MMTIGFILASGSGSGGSAAATSLVSDVLPPLLSVMGIVMLGVILTMSVRRKIARRNEAIPSPRERIDRIKTESRVHDDLHVAHAQLLDTAQRLASQLDAKAERLERLIQQAEQRLTALQTFTGEPVEVLSEAVREARGEHEQHAPPSIAPAEAAYGESRLAESVPRREPEPAPKSMPETTLDPLTRRVYELSDEGHNPVDIARALDEQIGKVELILALRAG